MGALRGHAGSALPLSAMSPLVSLSMALCPKAAQECLGCFQSLHWLKLAVGSLHVSEIKYNAKFFQVHDICFPGILSSLSALKDFLEVELVHREGVSSRVVLWNGCGSAGADLLMAAGDRRHQSGTKANSGASVGGDNFSPNGPGFSPLWHGGSLAHTAWPWFFFPPALSCLDFGPLSFTVSFQMWADFGERWMEATCLEIIPLSQTISPQSPPPFPIPFFATWMFVISALSLPPPQFTPFPLFHFPPSFCGKVAWGKHHWAQSSHLLAFHWCCKIGGKSHPSRCPWERPGGWR